jgi:DNA-binding transcriptional ArsR family regulator
MPSQPKPAAAPAVPDLARLAEMHAHAGEAAQLLKALANEQRLLVLCNLIERPLSVGELNARVDLSQSALSQHLALLREAGFVATRRESQSVYYSLPPGPVTRIMALLQDLYCSTSPARARRRNTRATAARRRAMC